MKTQQEVNIKRVYKKDVNVFEATQERLGFIFKEFDRIYLSFSGGKDSGVLLNLLIDYMRKHKITRKIGVQILDNEANYEMSLTFMRSILDANLDILDVYWCCLPITLPCTISAYAFEWQCWGEQDKARWIRPMPMEKYIVNINNCPFGFFEENMFYDHFWDEFGAWYGRELKSVSRDYECKEENMARANVDAAKRKKRLSLLSSLRLED